MALVARRGCQAYHLQRREPLPAAVLGADPGDTIEAATPATGQREFS